MKFDNILAKYKDVLIEAIPGAIQSVAPQTGTPPVGATQQDPLQASIAAIIAAGSDPQTSGKVAEYIQKLTPEQQKIFQNILTPKTQGQTNNTVAPSVVPKI